LKNQKAKQEIDEGKEYIGYKKALALVLSRTDYGKAEPSM
jgi:hypothetical protein